MNYIEKVSELFSVQLSEWELAGTNYRLLSKVKTRKINMGAFEMLVQYNPERMRSSAAKVDTKSIESRPCFLCSANRPKEQRGIPFDNDLTILINPFPIFPRHLTIPSSDHSPQRIGPNFAAMLLLARALPDYVIFYNGPECGASAPDHFHFQAGSRRFLPLETDYSSKRFASTFCGQKGLEIWHWTGYLRGMFTLEGDDLDKLLRIFSGMLRKLADAQPEKPEPMLNVIAYYQSGRWVVHIFPRKLHRPSQFFAEGERQILLSPASVDLGGVIITPREEDFIKLSTADVKDILGQVCPGDSEVLNLFE